MTPAIKRAFVGAAMIAGAAVAGAGVARAADAPQQQEIALITSGADVSLPENQRNNMLGIGLGALVAFSAFVRFLPNAQPRNG